MASRCRIRRKRRSGWRHPANVNRNHRRWEKRRRSASSAVRCAAEAIREAETHLDIVDARYSHLGNRGRTPDRRPERRPSRGLEPRRAW